MTLRWNCKTGCYLEQLPDWSMLDGCFGNTGVSVSDLDGYVHQIENVLFLEKKFRRAGISAEGIIERPQMRFFNARVRKLDSVIVIWCSERDGSDISKMRVFGIDGFDASLRLDATLVDFRAAVSKWWALNYQPGRL